MSSSFVIFSPGTSQRLYTVSGRCVQNSDKVQKTKWRLLQWRGCSCCLWWAHYFWNVSGNEDWSPSRSEPIYCDGHLYVSRHARLYTQWAESTPAQHYMLIKIIPASFHMCRYCRLTAGMHLEVQTFMKHTFMKHLRKKGAGACDVATDAISTHSFPRWQNVKTDSGGR